MKKILFTQLILFVLSTSLLFGQENTRDYTGHIPKKPIQEIGIFAGPSLGFLRGSPVVETNNINKRYLKLGHTIGVSATHLFSDRTALNALALFETKGGIVRRTNTYFDQVTQAMEAGETKQEFIYTSYSFPLMFSYAFGPHRRTHLSIGPYASYLKSKSSERPIIGLLKNRAQKECKTNQRSIKNSSGEVLYPYRKSLSSVKELQLWQVLSTSGA